MNEEMK